MSKIGIGIVTFNRLEYLERVIEGVRKHTTSDYELVVADDGSSDGTADWCRANDVRVITGANGGVCWNKNRALFALQEIGCDPILLLEDDCIPARDNWDWEWRIASALFGHVAFAHPKLDPWLISGSGTPTDPYVNNKATAQCSSASGIALSEVGFFDTRFKGYGVGHAEWTTRMKRAGHGFKKAIDKDGREVKANLYIVGGLVGEDAPTFKDKANVARNEKLFDELKKEPVYRHPWSSEEEKARFLAEQKAGGVNANRYMALTGGSEEDIAIGLGARHLRSYGKAFRRAFGEPRSFLRTSGWLSSMALSIPAYEGEIVPWFNYTVVDLLRDRVRPDWRVYEYGAGYSTLWWSKHAASVQSVEHDANWAELIQTLCGEKATIQVRPADDSFAQSIVSTDNTYDVIVVDGHDRPGCIRASLPFLTQEGVMIVDNSNRAEYREAISEVKATGFKELQLKGATPMTYKAETTSFLYREANCFDF